MVLRAVKKELRKTISQSYLSRIVVPGYLHQRMVDLRILAKSLRAVDQPQIESVLKIAQIGD